MITVMNMSSVQLGERKSTSCSSSSGSRGATSSYFIALYLEPELAGSQKAAEHNHYYHYDDHYDY